MSLKSWLKEFYPIKADKVSEKDALQHSLLKWRGALKTNLKKHRLKIHYKRITDKEGKYFNFHGLTCALCCVFRNTCVNCSLRSCGCLYSDFGVTDDPKPMIKLIRAAIKESDGKC